jgi:hypothetical protein
MVPAQIDHLFRHMARDIEPRQPWDTEQELYAHSKEGEKELAGLLAVATKKLQLKVYVPGHKPPISAYGEGQGFIRFAPIKSSARAAEKVEENGGHWNSVYDIVRASVAVNDVPHLWAVVEGLKQAGATLSRNPKNRFINPTPSGYRDALLNVRLPNGMIAEVQLHLKPILEAKGQGHKQYEIMREIEHLLPGQGGRMTPEQAKQYTQALHDSQRIYGTAWEKINNKDEIAKSQDESYRYYHMNHGVIVRHRDDDQPEMFHPTHKRWEPYQHLREFAFQATPVSLEHARKHIKDPAPKAA